MKKEIGTKLLTGILLIWVSAFMLIFNTNNAFPEYTELETKQVNYLFVAVGIVGIYFLIIGIKNYYSSKK